MSKAQQTTSTTLMTRLGAAAWIIGAIIFFAGHFIAQSAWSNPSYNWSINNVSDLGNIHCQKWGDNQRYVCSPLHGVMNASIIAEGALIIVGVIFIGFLWKKTFSSRAARGLLVIAAAAIVLVGFVPADVDENIHILGAVILTVFGHTGLILAGVALLPDEVGKMRLLAPFIGVIGIVATVLFCSGHYLGLGMGGMERFWVFTLQIWTFVMGCYVLTKHLAPSRLFGI